MQGGLAAFISARVDALGGRLESWVGALAHFGNAFTFHSLWSVIARHGVHLRHVPGAAVLLPISRGGDDPVAMPGVLSTLMGGISTPNRRLLGYLGAMAAVGAAIRAAGTAAADTPSALPCEMRDEEDGSQVAAAARTQRPGVNAEFFKQLLKLMKICIPSVFSAEAAWAGIAGGEWRKLSWSARTAMPYRAAVIHRRPDGDAYLR